MGFEFFVIVPSDDKEFNLCDIALSPSQTMATFQRNIVGCNMLRAFGYPVAMCCNMSGVVGSNLKMVKFFMQHLRMLHDVVVV